MMESGVKYITGTPRPGPLYALDETVDAIVQLGAHAMKGTPDGVLNHTMSSKWKYRFWYNGVETGEVGIVALAAGCYEIPVIMVTGDNVVCSEAHDFLGDQVVTVAVKEGIATESAILYPFEETRQALYEGAKKAMAAIGKCKPYKIKIPFTVKLEYVIPDEDPEKIRYIEHTYPDATHIYDILREEKPKI
jgi:D-amino peptidase